MNPAQMEKAFSKLEREIGDFIYNSNKLSALWKSAGSLYFPVLCVLLSSFCS